MDEWIAQIIQHVSAVPPSCLAGFQCSAVSSDVWNNEAHWSVRCRCGSALGSLLGYPLKSLNPNYKGEPFYVSPLSFRCSSCGEITGIIDTKLHGYNSEISILEETENYDSNYHGSGPPAAIPCPTCGSSEFSMTPRFLYSHFDLIDDEPELAPRAQDFFDGFELNAKCSSCGATPRLAGLELA